MGIHLQWIFILFDTSGQAAVMVTYLTTKESEIQQHKKQNKIRISDRLKINRHITK